MLLPGLTETEEDFYQILALQRQNLRQFVTDDEKQQQGFVTLQHTPEILRFMHNIAPSVVIRDNGAIIAYALTETIQCRHLMPELDPMFALLETLEWKGTPIRNIPFYTMGQICIAKAYRGQGLFEKLYQHHCDTYRDRFDLLITEISTSNPRSLRAHEKVGFEHLYTHREQDDEWKTVVWDWRVSSR